MRRASPWFTIGIAAAWLALAAAIPAQAATVSVQAGDLWFCDESFQSGVCTTAVQTGDTVVWSFGGDLMHTTTACGGSCDAPTPSPQWNSGFTDPGGSFSFTFQEAGTYLYYCEIHPLDMRGQIIVEAAPVPPEEQPTVVINGATSAVPQDGPTSSLPAAGSGPWDTALVWVWAATALAGAGGASVCAAIWSTRRHPR